MLGESLVAWLLLPLLGATLAFGLALLLERATGWRAPALRLPVGLSLLVCGSLAIAELGGNGPVNLGVLAALAVAGLVLGRLELRALRPGWPALAGAGAYLLHMAPVVLSGSWSWTGYNFVNDTSVQMLLAEYLQSSATEMPVPEQITTASEHVRVYFETAYPLGSHSLLGVLAQALPVPLEAVYQPTIALLAASVAIALAWLARRAGLPLAAAAAAGLVAAAANLFYQYSLQGNLKEIAFLAAFTGAAACGRELLDAERPERAVPATAACFAAAFAVYSAAAATYLVALGAALAVAGLATRRAGLRRLMLAGAGLLAGALLLALPALLSATRFNEIASGTFASAERAEDLGHLLRPLRLIQAAGVWLTGDYRGPVPGFRADVTLVLCVLVLILAAAGVAWGIRRREPGALSLLAASVVSAAYLLPRLSPYADGKVLALTSPLIVVLAAVGAYALGTLRRPVGLVAAGLVAGAILWSDAFAYHVVKLAPVDRLQALEQIGSRYRDADGLVMLNEPEELAKNFTGGAPLNVGTEAITPRQIELRAARFVAARHFDLDEHTLDYVEAFPVLILRRSPRASRPPANFELAYRNGWYEAWVRQRKPEVVDHLPLQAADDVASRPSCPDIRALAGIARPGEILVAARRPRQLELDTRRARRSAGWLPHPYLANMVITETPGEATAPDTAPLPGRYRAWVGGSFSRPVEARADGRVMGRAQGVNNVGQWLPAGGISLDAGLHRLALERGGGTLKPGDGYKGELGPLVLDPVARSVTLERLPPEDVARLCSSEWDWIELVRER